MTKFIQSTRGWINVSTVARAVWEDDHRRYRLYDQNGEALGTTSELSFDPRDVTGHTYISSTGIIAVCVGLSSSSGRPVAEDIHVSRRHVIAWKLIGSGYAEPVLTESVVDGDTVLIENPDGDLLSAEDCEFKDLASAKADVLARAQREWDSEHRAPQ